MSKFDELEISNSEKEILENFDFANNYLIEKISENEEKIKNDAATLELIKDTKSSIDSTVNIGNGSSVFIEKLKILSEELGKRYDEIMELNKKKDDEKDKSSGPGARSSCMINNILNIENSEGSNGREY